jgi:hypothetical protein
LGYGFGCGFIEVGHGHTRSTGGKLSCKGGANTVASTCNNCYFPIEIHVYNVPL